MDWGVAIVSINPTSQQAGQPRISTTAPTMAAARHHPSTRPDPRARMSNAAAARPRSKWVVIERLQNIGTSMAVM